MDGPRASDSSLLARYAAALVEDEYESTPTSFPSDGSSREGVTAATHVGSTVLERTGRRPHIRRGEPITSYSHAQLVKTDPVDRVGRRGSH